MIKILPRYFLQRKRINKTTTTIAIQKTVVFIILVIKKIKSQV
jgi:hypothetical protein